MTKACENCPEDLILNNALKSRREAEQTRELNAAALGRCTFFDWLSGQKAEIQNRLHSNDSLIEMYDRILPEGGDDGVATCAGPYERIEKTEYDRLYRQRICGARVLDHVAGTAIDKSDLQLDNDSTAEH